MPRPPGGHALPIAMRTLGTVGVDIVVSMLSNDQVVALGLQKEAAACAACGIEFLHFPVRDHDVPDDREAARAFAHSLAEQLQRGLGVVVHCLAGIGRSGLMAAAALAVAGFSVDDACARISAARGVRCPETPAQRQWLLETFPAPRLRP
jgi:protein-tyrosine phosphatase